VSMKGSFRGHGYLHDGICLAPVYFWRDAPETDHTFAFRKRTGGRGRKETLCCILFRAFRIF
jgi:hypothetical protein